ncbi:hypothetical protein ACF05L_05970 [Streptomyces bobili]|uniref:hypothetical protein n=1 Tax=Streptomyces bobili TaxID=67280 RepID=UPI0036FC93E6
MIAEVCEPTHRDFGGRHRVAGSQDALLGSVSGTAAFKKAAQSVTDQDLGPFWDTHRIR